VAVREEVEEGGVVEEESRKGGENSPDENPKSVCPAAAAEAEAEDCV